MSPSVKLGLLSLVSAAAAVPHYGHSRFHKPSGGYGTGTGAPFPTGGYGNATVLPSGTGVATEKTTTLLETQFSTETVYSTIYATRTRGGDDASSVAPEDVSTGAAACGPETVYVTATNKVTVTVTGGYPSGSASAAPSSAYSSFEAVIPSDVASSSAAPVSSAKASSSAPGGGYEVYPSISISMPNKPVETPVATPEKYTSAAPVSSAPASSAAPVSSAAPSPSGSPSYSGHKRGLAYNEASLCSAFDVSKFGFAYNWGATQYGGELPEGIMYSPMMHKPSDMTAQEWIGHADDAIKAGSTLVMGFNEPDHTAQANLQPAAACDYWKDYMLPVKASHGDITLLGPSVTNGPAPMGLAWLEEFNKCDNAKYDAVNIHFYDIYDNGAGTQRFKDHVDETIKKFGKKVYVTEYGLNPGSATDEEAATFLKETMEYMEGNDMVGGYAYFMVGQGSMMLNSGNGLSAVGKVYNS